MRGQAWVGLIDSADVERVEETVEDVGEEVVVVGGVEGFVGEAVAWGVEGSVGSLLAIANPEMHCFGAILASSSPGGNERRLEALVRFRGVCSTNARSQSHHAGVCQRRIGGPRQR